MSSFIRLQVQFNVFWHEGACMHRDKYPSCLLKVL